MADKPKRTKAQQAAITKKALATRRKNLRAAGKPVSKTTPAKKRKYTPKKRGMLSAMTGAEGRNAFRQLASGVVGGGLYLIYEDQVTIPGSTPEKKAVIAVVGAYILATMGKRPNVASGIIGAAAYDFFKVKGLLSDSADTQMKRMKYADPLQNVPVSLSDDAMLLAQSGQMNLADAQTFDLQQDSRGVYSYQPVYAQTDTF